MEEFINGLINWCKENPYLVLFILYVLLQLYQRNQSFPTIEGAKVRFVKDLQELEALKKECKEKGSCMVVNGSAKWCGPCRSSWPIFAKMSMLYNENDITFAKFDVDEARDVAGALAINAMPTFKVYDSEGKELKTIVGWRESELRGEIVKAINSK